MAVTKAVRPVPGEGATDQVRNNNTGLEPGELSGPTRDRDLSLTGRNIEYDMSEGDIVAIARRVEKEVTVEHWRNSSACIDDPGAWLDRLQS